MTIKAPANPQEDSLANHRVVWWKRSLFQVLLAAMIGALLGGPGYRAVHDPRINPFSSREAELLETRMVNKIEAADYAIKLEDKKLGERLDRMDTRMTSMTTSIAGLPPKTLLERVTRMEEQLKYLLKKVDKRIHLGPGGPYRDNHVPEGR